MRGRLRVIGYGVQLDMRYTFNDHDTVWDGFTGDMLNGATLMLDEAAMQPEPGRIYISSDEILKDRRLEAKR